MQSSALLRHSTKIVDYAIRTAFVSLVAIPLLFWLSMSGGLGSEPPENGEQCFGFVLVVVLAPAHHTLALVHRVGISLDFLDWMLGVLVVPLFWGAVAYGLVQLCRVLLRRRGQVRRHSSGSR